MTTAQTAKNIIAKNEIRAATVKLEYRRSARHAARISLSVKNGPASIISILEKISSSLRCF
jgi:hypothetical protein